MCKSIIKKTGIVIFLIVLIVSAQQKGEKRAIVVTAFGTSYPKALKAITNIGEKVKSAFPSFEVKYAFTSNIIRKIWQKRQRDTKFINENGSLIKDFVDVKTPLATIADLQNRGYKIIYVQPTHIYAGESYHDLKAYIDGLNSISTIKKKYNPFTKLVLGRPALGKPGIEHNYQEDLEIAAKSLQKDIDYAKKKKAALVYMGHGNEHFSTGVYIEMQDKMRAHYAYPSIYIGNVEGYPSLNTVLHELKRDKINKIVLKPFMVVAGDHAANDMASDESDSWKSIFSKQGMKVECIVEGLGENDQFAGIYVNHLRDLIQ